MQSKLQFEHSLGIKIILLWISDDKKYLPIKKVHEILSIKDLRHSSQKKANCYNEKILNLLIEWQLIFV